MAIRMTCNTDILDHQANIRALEAPDRQTFIDNRAVPRGSLQRVAQCFRRGCNIEEQSQLSKIG